mmetsp:Transcript_28722/g.48194  ORF Transcript_28722/g.48194 Transcript_28722/m.48194 type:complete len:212 (-) Transcript_28722:982-1617(-)
MSSVETDTELLCKEMASSSTPARISITGNCVSFSTIMQSERCFRFEIGRTAGSSCEELAFNRDFSLCHAVHSRAAWEPGPLVPGTASPPPTEPVILPTSSSPPPLVELPPTEPVPSTAEACSFRMLLLPVVITLPLGIAGSSRLLRLPPPAVWNWISSKLLPMDPSLSSNPSYPGPNPPPPSTAAVVFAAFLSLGVTPVAQGDEPGPPLTE